MMQPIPAKQHLVRLLAALFAGQRSFVGCYCEDAEHCHRTLLRQVVERRPERSWHDGPAQLATCVRAARDWPRCWRRAPSPASRPTTRRLRVAPNAVTPTFIVDEMLKLAGVGPRISSSIWAPGTAGS
jgi:hypothetical protein